MDANTARPKVSSTDVARHLDMYKYYFERPLRAFLFSLLPLLHFIFGMKSGKMSQKTSKILSKSLTVRGGGMMVLSPPRPVL